MGGGVIGAWGITASGAVVELPGLRAGSTGIARHNNVGSAVLEWSVNAATSRLMPRSAEPFRNVVVYDGAVLLHSGPVVEAEMREDTRGGHGTVTVASSDDNVWLARRRIYPDPSRAETAQTTRTHDKHGPAPASTVLHSMVHAHLGAGARSERQLPGLQAEPDPGVGPSLTSSDRWRVLLEAMSRYATWANLAFRISRDRTGRIAFRVWQPRDRRREVVFTLARHTAREIEDKQTAPSATVVIGAGQGDGTGRLIIAVNDAADTAAFGRIEEFRDARHESDPALILPDIQAQLEESRSSRAVTVTPETNRPFVYGRDYQLGDWVTAGRGDDPTLQVQEVKWTLTKTGSVTYRPFVGTPGTTDTPASIIAGRATLSRVHQIEEAQ